MSTWLPWLDETPTFVELRCAGRTIQLNRLQIGDTKVISRREVRHQDLILSQRAGNRPRVRHMEVHFGGFKKTGDMPSDWQYPMFLKIMYENPGWPVTLIWPDKTITHGIITEHSYDEIGDCQYDIFFKFEILREYPLGKVIQVLT